MRSNIDEVDVDKFDALNLLLDFIDLFSNTNIFLRLFDIIIC